MLVPCGSREDKKGVSAAEHRLKMTQLTAKEFFHRDFPVTVNDIEVKNGPMIMTYKLILQLQQQADEEIKQKLEANLDHHEEERQIFFVLGSDLIPSLDKWTSGKEFIENTPCIVFNRKGVGSLSDAELLAHPNYPKTKTTHVNVEDSIVGIVSSSEVRKRINQIPLCYESHLGISGLVTPSVIDYIKDNMLYGSQCKP